ncbi:hypothetical protein RyT2_04110 [Pseudolactococcus yaeyamensis]
MTLEKLSVGLFEKCVALVLMFAMGTLFLNRGSISFLVYIGVLSLITLLFALLNMSLFKKYDVKTKLVAFLLIVSVEVLAVMLYEKGFDTNKMIANMGQLDAVSTSDANQSMIERLVYSFVPFYLLTLLCSGVNRLVSKKN